MILSRVKTGVILLASLLFIACGQKINSIEHPSFDENGVLNEDISDAFYSAVPTASIRFYIEASGSMNGLFRPGKPTAFKRNMWSVLSRNRERIPGVKAFINGTSRVVDYSIDDFRTRMNNGGLISAASTVVPDMLQKVLNDLGTGECEVAVFVSDMKYSPVGGSATAIDQYAIDIQSMFSSHRNYSVSVIGLESEYIAVNGSVACPEFPYYMLVIGEGPKAAFARNQIMSALGGEDAVKGCIDYNASYGCPYYSVYPIAGVLGLKQNIHEVAAGRDKCFYSFSGYSPAAGVAEFVVAIRGQHIPYSILSSLDRDDFTLNSYTGGSKLDWELVEEPSLRSADDKRVNQFVDPNLFLKIRIEEMLLPTDVISIRLKTPKEETQWIRKYYGASREGDLHKTFSINGFIDGLKGAYPSAPNLQTDPMVVLISDYN